MHNKHEFSVKLVSVIILSLLLFSVWGLVLVLINDDSVDPRNQAAENTAATITVCDSGCNEVDINVAISKVAENGVIIINMDSFDGPAIISRKSDWPYKLPEAVRNFTIKGKAEAPNRTDWRYNEVAPNGHIIEISELSNVKINLQNLALKNSADSSIHFKDGVDNTDLVMTNMEIEDSKTAGLYMNGENNSFIIKDSVFSGNTGSGVSIHGTIEDSKIEKSVFKKHKDDALGFNIDEDSGSVELINNKITGFANHGVFMINHSYIKMYNNLITPQYEDEGGEAEFGIELKDNAGMMMFNNVIDGQSEMQTGLKFSASGLIEVGNNIIVSNDRAGIEQDMSSPNDRNWFDYNILYSNGSNYIGVTGGSNSKTVDPKFKDAINGDYTLQAGSPAIDAGEPSIKDPNNSRSDIGMFGGPNAQGSTGGNDPTGECSTPPENGSYIDFNADGEIDIRDFVCFRNEYVENV